MLTRVDALWPSINASTLAGREGKRLAKTAFVAPSSINVSSRRNDRKAKSCPGNVDKKNVAAEKIHAEVANKTCMSSIPGVVSVGFNAQELMDSKEELWADCSAAGSVTDTLEEEKAIEMLNTSSLVVSELCVEKKKFEAPSNSKKKGKRKGGCKSPKHTTEAPKNSKKKKARTKRKKVAASVCIR